MRSTLQTSMQSQETLHPVKPERPESVILGALRLAIPWRLASIAPLSKGAFNGDGLGGQSLCGLSAISVYRKSGHGPGGGAGRPWVRSG